MTWTYSEIISSLAFGVSAIGLLISYLSFRKASQHDVPNAWGEIHSIGVENCWRLSIHLRNPTKYDIRPDGLGVPIERIPVDAKQDFLLGDYDAALKECGGDTSKLSTVVAGKDTGIKIGVTANTIPAGEEGVVYALLFRGKLSVAAVATITLTYKSMEETPRYLTRKVKVPVSSRGMTFQLDRT